MCSMGAPSGCASNTTAAARHVKNQQLLYMGPCIAYLDADCRLEGLELGGDPQHHGSGMRGAHHPCQLSFVFW